MRRSHPGNGAQLAAHLVNELLREPGGDPGPEGQLLGGLHERAPCTGRFLAGHAPLAHPDLQIVATDRHVLDPVHRPSLDPGGQHPARGAGRVGGDGFDQDLPPGSFLDHLDDAVVSKVQQNRRSIDWPGILEHGS